jgi:hypothetical protein
MGVVVESAGTVEVAVGAAASSVVDILMTVRFVWQKGKGG